MNNRVNRNESEKVKNEYKVGKFIVECVSNWCLEFGKEGRRALGSQRWIKRGLRAFALAPYFILDNDDILE